ncbi:MAG: endonuclease/exonuclease/phosphatase family protein [Methylophilus sp.]
MHNNLTITTINIHKGMGSFNARAVLHKQRDLIRQLDSDIVFLQEVCGVHTRNIKLTTSAQFEFLADSIWSDFAYGQNAITEHGHHGNAILSKFPITQWENLDVSANAIEQRGLLHCEIAIPSWQQNLHCVCVHLGLMDKWRGRQLATLNTRINSHVPATAPLIIAGDFNDWRQNASKTLKEQQHLTEVFKATHGAYARSFPAMLPLFKLDRVYTRGFKVVDCAVFGHSSTTQVSDHAALTAHLLRI